MPEKYRKLPTLTPQEINRFWKRVNVTNPDDCWFWITKNQSDYGRFWVRGSNFRTHRVAYYLANGRDPEELNVLHICDNPPCCNPAHLFLGTQADNIADMCAKKRNRTIPRYKNPQHLNPDSVRGSKNPNAKLTEGNVREIRKLYGHNENSYTLARRFGVNPVTIQAILRGKSWKHI